MIFKKIALLMLLILASTACSLSAREESLEAAAQATSTDVVLNAADINATATQIAQERQPANTATPTVTPRPQSNTTTSGQNTSSSGTAAGSTQPIFRSNCTPQNTWPLYTVIAGDTLAGIARRTNSTVTQIADANCLANANLISTGQQLRVPQLPTSTSSGSITTVGELKIDPVIRFENNVALLNPGQTVTLSWSGAPVNELIQVEFTLISSNNSNNLISLGVDSNLNDGVAIYWTVPQDVNGRIIASGRLPGQTGAARSSKEVSVSTGQSRSGQVIINPYERVDPHGMVLIRAGTKATLTWPALPTAGVQRVEFYYFRPSAAGSPSILGTDNNLSDGVSFAWTVPDNLSGELSAIAYLSNGTQIRTAQGTPMTTTFPNEVAPLGQVRVANGQLRSDGWYELKNGEAALLTWTEAPTTASRVEFYSAPSGTGMTPTLIGTDNNLSDGAGISWQAPAGFMGHLSAKVYMSDGYVYETPTLTAVIMNLPPLPVSGKLVIDPNIGFDGTTFTMDRNAVVTVRLVDSDLTAVSYVDFYYHVEVSGIDEQTVHIGRDGSMGDGAQVSWHIPGGVGGYIYATAVMNDGRARESNTVRVYAEIIR